MLLALVTAKYCSDSTLLKLIISIFVHVMLFFSVFDGKIDLPGHVLPKMSTESHSIVNLCLVFV